MALTDPVSEQFEHLRIQLEAIKSATNNFADENCIGIGGFGKVYKGELCHSKGQTIVAIKRLDPRFGQGNPEFWKEIIMLSLYKHDNIISLIGFCDDSGEKILIYKYASKKSLDLYLSKDDLTWIRRLNICIGAARGLAHLHNPGGTQQRVLHRDIKSSNILLDENWNAMISDLGLSKFGPANQRYTFLVSHTVGTLGYLDPVYVESGLLTKESDVYSFGVVLFEILCGRLSIDNKNDNHPSLTALVRKYYEEKKIKEIVYSNIQDEMNPKSLEAYTTIAYQCLNTSCKARPLMTEVVSTLENALEYQANAAESSEVVDIKPITRKHIEITDSSRLTAQRLPDPMVANKVLQLVYTNAGTCLIVLDSSAIHKVWRWGKKVYNPSGKSSASIVPQLHQSTNGAVMPNDINERNPPEDSTACIALSKNDEYILSASGGKVSQFQMWNNFKVKTTFLSPPPAATYLAIHPEDNNIVAVGKEDSTIDIYNISLNKVISRLEGHQKQITGLAFSQALKSLVSSGADAQLCMWSTSEWKKLKSRSLQSPPNYPFSLVGDIKVQYHNDQRHLLVVHESHFAIYDPQLECLKLFSTRESRSAPVSSATYTCDCRRIIAGFLDGVVCAFDALSFQLYNRISPSAYVLPSFSSSKSTAYPMVVAAHPSDPKQFALGMSDGSVHVIETLTLRFTRNRKWGYSTDQEGRTLASSNPSNSVLNNSQRKKRHKI